MKKRNIVKRFAALAMSATLAMGLGSTAMALNTYTSELLVPVDGAYVVTKTLSKNDFQVPLELFFMGRTEDTLSFEGFDNKFEAENNIEWTVDDPDNIIKEAEPVVTSGKEADPIDPDSDTYLITSTGTVTVKHDVTGTAVFNVKYEIRGKLYRTQLTLVVEEQ